MNEPDTDDAVEYEITFACPTCRRPYEETDDE